jgi:hypothetical protein
MTNTPADPAALREAVARIVSNRALAAMMKTTDRLTPRDYAAADSILALPELTRATELAAETARADAAEKLVYVPGVWVCPKCKFQLVQSNLNASTGSVTARDEPDEKCPNCATPLWRTTYRDEYKHWAEGYETLLVERTLPAEQKITALTTAAREAEQALEPFATELMADVPDARWIRVETDRTPSEERASNPKEPFVVLTAITGAAFRQARSALTKLRNALGGA